MFDKPTSFHTIGLEKESLFIKAAKLSLLKGKPHIDSLYQLSFDAKLDFEKHLIVTAIEGSDVLIRPLEVKLKKSSDIDDVLAFQAEPLLPYPIENAVLDHISLERTNEGSQLNVLAVKKDHIEGHLASWKALEIEPEVVSCIPHNLAIFSGFAFDSQPLFIVHLSDSQTTCTLVREGKLIASQSFAFGKYDFEKIAGDALATIDFSTLPAQDKLYEFFDNWRKEVIRFLYALTKQRREAEPLHISLTGEGASLINLGQVLAESMQKSFLQPTPVDSISSKDLLFYAVPIGAALSAFPNATQVNFRQAELAYPNPWKRLVKPLAAYYALCIGLAMAFYLFGSSYLGLQEDALRNEYVELLTTMNKSYNSFEKEYADKHHIALEIAGVPNIADLTSVEITERLQDLHREMKDSPDLFPLLPAVPKVSDVLAWLSSHPLVKTAEEEAPKIQIENFSYSMIKRPEPKKPSERYQVKVEIDFTTITPKVAREFHDALIAPNEIVDPKGEVKWSSNRGKYHTSFFLKDKTVYPSQMGSGG